MTKESPLAGIRIVEFAGIGPAPFAAMILAGLGADVIRIDKPESFELSPDTRFFTSSAMDRDRRSIALDLKLPEAIEVVKKLVAKADGVIEGFRPGVMERLGLGPEKIMQTNPTTTFVRMTGWGQGGPLSHVAGHDLNFIGITGLLNAIGPEEFPAIPLNLVGDFGGGGAMAAVGMLAGIVSAKVSGRGSVVDAAIVDGVALMGTMFEGLISQGLWSLERSRNLLDGGAPFYCVYRCADGKNIALASLEPKFFAEMRTRLGLAAHDAFANQYDRAKWPEMRRVLTELFSKDSRAYFEELFQGADACVSPVLDLNEAKASQHSMERGMFQDVRGVSHPVPAPRFEGFSPRVSAPPLPGQDRSEILEELGFSAQEIIDLENSGAFG